MPASLSIPARVFLVVALFALAPFAVAQAQSLDGTWIMFDDASDPELARLAAAGATLPRDQLERTRRIEFTGATATVHASGAVVTLTLEPTPAEWGVDARVIAVEGSDAPIDFLRLELPSPGAGTLTTFSGQIQLEQFAILRVRSAG